MDGVLQVPSIFTKNQQGDVTGILDGTQVVSYRYDAWGRPLSCTGSAAATVGEANPIRYRGYYYDKESGLYYLNSRYYDPEVGRFLAPDTIELVTATPTQLIDKNLYAYCDNNPTDRLDVEGEFWISALKAVVGAVVNVATTWVAAKVTGQEYGWGDAAAAAASGATGGLLGGLISGGYAVYTNLKNGASFGKALASGVATGFTTGISVGTLSDMAKIPVRKAAKVASDATIGLGGNCIAAASTKWATQKEKPKRTGIQTKTKAETKVQKSDDYLDRLAAMIHQAMKGSSRSRGLAGMALYYLPVGVR